MSVPAGTTTLGPVQMLVVGFEGDHFTGEILRELQRLTEHDVIRLIDLLVVRRDENGTVETLKAHDSDGDIVGELIGLDAEEEDPTIDEDEAIVVADAIAPGSAAGIALIEHRWAVGLRGAVERANGTTLVDAWVHPEDLSSAGVRPAG